MRNLVRDNGTIMEQGGLQEQKGTGYDNVPKNRGLLRKFMDFLNQDLRFIISIFGKQSIAFPKGYFCSPAPLNERKEGRFLPSDSLSSIPESSSLSVNFFMHHSKVLRQTIAQIIH